MLCFYSGCSYRITRTVYHLSGASPTWAGVSMSRLCLWSVRAACIMTWCSTSCCTRWASNTSSAAPTETSTSASCGRTSFLVGDPNINVIRCQHAVWQQGWNSALTNIIVHDEVLYISLSRRSKNLNGFGDCFTYFENRKKQDYIYKNLIPSM